MSNLKHAFQATIALCHTLNYDFRKCLKHAFQAVKRLCTKHPQQPTITPLNLNHAFQATIALCHTLNYHLRKWLNHGFQAGKWKTKTEEA